MKWYSVLLILVVLAGSGCAKKKAVLQQAPGVPGLPVHGRSNPPCDPYHDPNDTWTINEMGSD